jgi:hypothetical protein
MYKSGGVAWCGWTQGINKGRVLSRRRSKKRTRRMRIKKDKKKRQARRTRRLSLVRIGMCHGRKAQECEMR